VSDEIPPAAEPNADPDQTIHIELGAMTSGLSPEPERPRSKRRLTIITAITAVLVAGVGAGAYAGVRAWTGAGITEPETAVPASLGAFVRLDLKPGYRDQMAFDGLAKKFPSGSKSTTDLITDAERKMLKGSGLDFDTDVAPWFGQRAGIGAYAVSSSRAVALVALASTDNGKAKQALDKERARAGKTSFGYVLRGGYALLAIDPAGIDLQSVAQQASREAAEHSLASDASFRSAVGHLDGHNLLIGYANMAKLGPMAASLTRSGIPLAMGAMPGGMGAFIGSGARLGLDARHGGSALMSSGTFAIGGSVTDDGLEIRMHTEGMPVALKNDVDAMPKLAAMPSSSTLGLALNGFDPDGDTFKQLVASLTAIPMMTGGGAAVDSGMVTALNGLATSVLTAKLLTVDVGDVTGSKPSMVITAEAGDASSAQSLASQLSGLAANPAAGVSVTADGPTVTAVIGQAPAGTPLSSDPLFRTATNGMSHATIAAYVDVQKLVTLDHNGAAPSTLIPVKAVGLAVTSHGTGSDELIRVVITK
jgi:hypothetical protein